MVLQRLKAIVRDSVLREKLDALRNSRASYSQFGEDVHIASYYGRLAFDRKINVTTGCFVDIGACRPIVGSNSYAFHRRGWKCINVDPTPGSKLRFDRVRPSDENLQVAVGPADGEGTMYLFGTPSVWNTLDPEAAQLAAGKINMRPATVSVPIRRLETILDAHLDGVPFEILSIDAEGYDYQVLQSNNFDRYRPRVILTETHDLDLDSLQDNRTVRFFVEKGYVLYSWINPNLMFIRADSQLAANG